MSLKRLFAILEEKYPGITKTVLRGCLVSVNLEYVDFEWDEVAPGGDRQEGGLVGKGGEGKGGEGGGGEVVLKAGDEVGIIPPVSSG